MVAEEIDKKVKTLTICEDCRVCEKCEQNGETQFDSCAALGVGAEGHDNGPQHAQPVCQLQKQTSRIMIYYQVGFSLTIIQGHSLVGRTLSHHHLSLISSVGKVVSIVYCLRSVSVIWRKCNFVIF